MDKGFLNRKEVPTNRQILNYFFSKEDIEEIMDSLEFSMNDSINSISDLGEPDEVETEVGTEWQISRVKWNTENGPRYLIYLKKVNTSFSDIDLNKIDYTMNSTDDEQFGNPFFNYNNVEDIEYEDVEPLTFQEQLDLAIEYEEFEEAARLRDWNQGLLDLMKDLKPKFIEAIEKADLDALDRYQKRINEYRQKL